MTTANDLLLHTDTIFEGLLSDGIFVGMLTLLFVAIISLIYKYFKKK